MTAIALCSTKDLSRDEWLSKRKNGIGGSDIGAIMGFNKYRNKLDVYLDKTTDDINDYQSDAAYWGTVLEDVVAKEFEKRTGKKVRKKNVILQHPDYPYMLANIDREIVGEKALLECKTANSYFGKDWVEDEVPASYILQVQHYLAVTGYEKAYIAVLIGGQKFVYKEIERDSELIDCIIKECKDFWENHVVKKEPPRELDFVSKEAVGRLYRTGNGESVNLDSEYDDDFKTLQAVKETIKELKIQQENIENKIKLALGENEIGSTTNYITSWKNQTRQSIDMDKLKREHNDAFVNCLKTSTSRVFRFKEVK